MLCKLRARGGVLGDVYLMSATLPFLYVEHVRPAAFVAPRRVVVIIHVRPTGGVHASTAEGRWTADLHPIAAVTMIRPGDGAPRVLLHLGLPATVIAVPTQVHARLGEREESAAIPLREVLGRCSISRRRRPRLLFVRIFGGFSDFSSPPRSASALGSSPFSRVAAAPIEDSLAVLIEGHGESSG